MKEFLSLPRLQARLTDEQAAWLLGFRPEDVTRLTFLKLLVPCGRPAPNAPKYHATVTIQRLAEDPVWIDKATKALADWWVRKNSTRRKSRTRSTLSMNTGLAPESEHSFRSPRRNRLRQRAPQSTDSQSPL